MNSGPAEGATGKCCSVAWVAGCFDSNRGLAVNFSRLIILIRIIIIIRRRVFGVSPVEHRDP